MRHHTTKVARFFWKKKGHIIVIISILIFILAIFSYLTNPFTKYNIFNKHLVDVQKQGEDFTVQIDPIYVTTNYIVNRLALAKSGWHIFINRLDPRFTDYGETYEEIVDNVHAYRFDQQNPFIISGEHFSVLYPRSLGIFYHSLLDPRTAHNQQDWENRQYMYLKTLGFVLEVYDSTNVLSTTIVPISRKSVSLINVYAPPSDTLYSILYGLYITRTSDAATDIYRYENDNDIKLHTVKASKALQSQYKESLQRHIHNYRKSVFDEQTGLIKKDIVLSSTKDSVKRSSSFYDNVMYWRTIDLAQKLGLISPPPEYLTDLKKRIIDTYWLDDRGYFLEELGAEAVEHNWFSSDYLIAYQTGFLDPELPEDRIILEKSVKYIIDNQIDQPFAMRYQMEVRPSQLHRTVRVFATEYGSTAIWSHWGMEYIKLLIHLSQVTGNKAYLDRAHEQLKIYKENIEEYGGFPEVYETTGELFRSRFYIGIRSTGWIVNYEQALAMYNWTEQNWEQFEK